MSYYEFGNGDIIHNVLRTHPEYYVHIYNNKTYINYNSSRPGKFGTNINGTANGEVSLFELNVDRASNNRIYPFITKSGARAAFKTVSTSTFDDTSQFRLGDEIKGDYPLTASINRILVPSGIDSSLYNFNNENGQEVFISVANNKKYIRSLKATLRNYEYLSERFNYDKNSFGTGIVNMICVPSIFYGSSIERGSVTMKFNISGSTVAEISDTKKNGELIQTTGSAANDGKVAGVVMYNEGIVLLTGSWDLSNSPSAHQENYNAAGDDNPKWIYFGAGMTSVGTSASITGILSSSFEMNFRGTNKIPVLTMMAHAPRGEVNYSNNPTFLEHGSHESSAPHYSSDGFIYIENKKNIKNIKKSDFNNHTASFEKITYISKVGIYDSQKNLIAVANLATPLKKEENKEYTFKIKMDF